MQGHFGSNLCQGYSSEQGKLQCFKNISCVINDSLHEYTQFIIIIIIIKACRQHGFVWLFHCPSASFIAFVKSYKRHQVFAKSWWMCVFAGRPTLVCPCIKVHRRILLMSLSLLPTYLPSLTWFVRWEVSGRATAVFRVLLPGGINKQKCCFNIF